MDPKKYFDSGPNRFYYREAYNPEEKSFEEVPDKARANAAKGKVCGRGVVCIGDRLFCKKL